MNVKNMMLAFVLLILTGCGGGLFESLKISGVDYSSSEGIVRVNLTPSNQEADLWIDGSLVVGNRVYPVYFRDSNRRGRGSVDFEITGYGYGPYLPSGSYILRFHIEGRRVHGTRSEFSGTWVYYSVNGQFQEHPDDDRSKEEINNELKSNF